MERFKRYGITLVATLSLVTVVLLVTGWGSAAADNVASVIVANTKSSPVPVQETNTDANRNIKVHEQGTANTREQNTDANGDIKVHEQGTANVNVTNTTAIPINGSVSINGTPSVNLNGTPSVNIGNFPAASTTAVISRTSGHFNPLEPYTPLDQIDTRAYRSVTIYLSITNGWDPGSGCNVVTFDPDGNGYVVDKFSAGGSSIYTTKTYDPAPPNLTLACADQSSHASDYHVMLTGRTG